VSAARVSAARAGELLVFQDYVHILSAEYWAVRYLSRMTTWHTVPSFSSGGPYLALSPVWRRSG
jgi:hypothetical protein